MSLREDGMAQIIVLFLNQMLSLSQIFFLFPYVVHVWTMVAQELLQKFQWSNTSLEVCIQY